MCKLCLMSMEILNTKIVVNVRLYNPVFLSVFLAFRKTDWHFKIVQNWHFTYVYLNIFSCVSNIAVCSSIMLFLYWKSKMMTQVCFVSKRASKVLQNMFLKHLYRKSVQWVFQVCNMILGEGWEEERKKPFIFIFAIHPLFWSIRRKDEFSLFSTHQMIMDTHSKLILSQRPVKGPVKNQHNS
jgi:hypothetical protein